MRCMVFPNLEFTEAHCLQASLSWASLVFIKSTLTAGMSLCMIVRHESLKSCNLIIDFQVPSMVKRSHQITLRRQKKLTTW